MIARRLPLLLLGLATSAAALRAAQSGPPPAIDPKGALPASLSAAPASSPPAAAAPDSVPSAPSATVHAATPTPADGELKPGILSAAKAKGPPPVSKSPTVPIPLSPRFQQVRDRIGVLFNMRGAAAAPLDAGANPFRPVGVAPVAPLPISDGATPVPVAINGDLTSLQQAVATIRVKGTVTRNKVLQLVMNTGPGKEGTYKEGDVINVALPVGEAVHVRVRQISAHSVTLTVNEAEMVLKF